MFVKNLCIALRRMNRHRVYSSINIAGLAIGLAVFLLMTLLIRFEFSFDRFHEKADRICRVEQLMVHNGQPEAMTGCPTPLSMALKSDYPEFKAVTRVIGSGSLDIARSKDEPVHVEQSFYVDDSFLDIFTFPLTRGNPRGALRDPQSVVLSEKVASALFGKEDPLGQTIRTVDGAQMKITGIMKDIPSNSHLNFDALISIPTLTAQAGEDIFKQWHDNWVPLYVEVAEGADVARTSEKIRLALKRYQHDKSPHQLYLRPLTDIHLRSDVHMELGINGSMKNIYIFFTVAILVLAFASLNFINLSTAQSMDRAREIGLRKVVGAHRRALIGQVLSESMVTTFTAMMIALAFVWLLLPAFGTMAKRQLSVDMLTSWPFAALTLATLFVVSLLSGIYPAFFLSAFQPIRVLRGKLSSGARNITLRRSLVALQFCLATLLVIGTTTVLRQVHYLLNKDLGYKPDQIVTFPVSNASPDTVRALRDALLLDNRIVNAGISDYMPHSSTNWTNIGWEGGADEDSIKVNINYVDERLMDTYGMTIVKGRGFSREFGTDAGNAVILNETAARMIGWPDPIGKRIEYNVDYRSRSVNGGTVVGVVKDFHFRSLHDLITPLMIRLYPKDAVGSNISVKISGREIPATIAYLEETVRRFFPGQPFDYRFLDEDFQRMYQEEMRLGRVTSYLTTLAIVIACLGLFGLTSYTVRQRTREIGIRKAIGASTGGVVRLILADYLKLVVAASLPAWPIGYLMLQQWLQRFPYHTTINVGVLALSTLSIFMVASLTTIYQSVRAARANPVESLRHE